MDTVTQMAFGAVVGQAGWRHRFGRWALVVGACAALLPDLDVLIQTGDPFAGWIYHRGFSHSVFGAPLLGLLVGLGFWAFFNYKYKKGNKDLLALAEKNALSGWLWLGALAGITHIWLDVLTPYGTQLLAPLSDTRFALGAMPIIDLTYSAILFIAIAAGVSLRVPAKIAQGVAGIAIILSVCWQVLAWDVNQRAETLARLDFSPAAKIHSYPTLFTPYLRRITAEENNLIHVGFWHGEGKISWRAYERQYHPLIEKVEKTRAFKILHWFAREKIFWRIYPRADGSVRVEAHDLRYLTALPNDKPRTPLSSMWGVRQDFDKNGTPLGAPRRWTARPGFSRVLSFFSEE